MLAAAFCKWSQFTRAAADGSWFKLWKLNNHIFWPPSDITFNVFHQMPQKRQMISMSSLISSQTSTNFRKVFTDDGEPSVEKVRFSSDLGSITTRFKNLGNGLLKSTILENKMALFGLIQDTSKIKIVLGRICIGTLLAFVLNRCHLRNPLKKMFLSENVIFGDLGFPSVTLVNKSLKALCLNSRMVYQHLLYTLSLWTC